MVKLEVVIDRTTNGYVFGIGAEGDPIINYDFCGYANQLVHCSFCSMFVDDNYVDIILNLKKAGLLDREYPMVCCGCKRTLDTAEYMSYEYFQFYGLPVRLIEEIRKRKGKCVEKKKKRLIEL